MEKVKPFIKWVGGKRGIMKKLLSKLPNKINNYFEPFVGGGALFFEIHRRAKKSYLSDINAELINTYSVIKEDLDSLIALLKEHRNKHNDAYYYKVRGEHELQDPIQIAARFIYLNQTCFNGLYRVNRKGRFNVPVGKYTNSRILQADNLQKVSEVLKKTEIKLMDFAQITPQKGDFVYIDPPYDLTNVTSFVNYNKTGFSKGDQIRLRDLALTLTKRGVKVLLSNSNSPFILDIYKGSEFNIEIIDAPRRISVKANQSGIAKEVLIKNY